MFKFLIPLVLSGFVPSYTVMAVSWGVVRVGLMVCSDLVQRIFFFVGFSKPMIVLSLWVRRIMLFASISRFSNKISS